MDDNIILKVIGQRVRDLRKLKELSQEQLGELAGFHYSYIGGLERGEKNVTLLNLGKIAQALDVPINEFFKYERQLKQKKSDKDVLLNDLMEKLVLMESKDLRKLQRLIDDVFT